MQYYTMCYAHNSSCPITCTENRRHYVNAKPVKEFLVWIQFKCGYEMTYIGRTKVGSMVASVEFWQARPLQRRPHHGCAVTFYFSKFRQNLSWRSCQPWMPRVWHPARIFICFYTSPLGPIPSACPIISASFCLLYFRVSVPEGIGKK